MKVPFVDMNRMHEPIKNEVIESLASIVDNSAFVMGPILEEFEKNFANYIGSTYAVGVNSGFDALQLALIASGVKAGDEVITQANTFIATAFAISAIGAKPVLVDVDEEYCMNTSQLEKAYSKKTKAIIPVHLYGQAAPMNEVREFAKANDLIVIEDAAQAHGATYNNEHCGNMGTCGCFSFYPGKNLGAMGEGGAVTTNDKVIYEKLLALRNVGQSQKYQHDYKGFNSRLHTMQAKILDIKLKHLNDYNNDRIEMAGLYEVNLIEIKQLKTPLVLPENKHVFHLYVIEILESAGISRDELQKQLGERGVASGIHYPIPIHLQKAYNDLGYKVGDFPVTEQQSQGMLSLPIFPGMTAAEVGYVCESLTEILS